MTYAIEPSITEDWMVMDYESDPKVAAILFIGSRAQCAEYESKLPLCENCNGNHAYDDCTKCHDCKQQMEFVGYVNRNAHYVCPSGCRAVE